MLLKCAVILLVILSVQSVTLQGRNIPVGIRYERLDHDITSNLAENDLKENPLRLEKLNVAEENLLVPETDHSNLIKNLDEKIQLSNEKLLQSSKHLAIHQSIKEAPEYDDLDLDILGEPLPATSSVVASNKASLIPQAQEIIEKDLKHLKNSFLAKEDEIASSTELWEKLEREVEKYFLEQKNKLGPRQGTNQQNSLKNFVIGFQQLTNNFIQQFHGKNQSNQPAASGDERSDIAGAGTARWKYPSDILMDMLTSRIQYIVNNLQNLGQNVFQRPQQGNGQILSDNNTQGDTGTANPTETQQQGFFSGAVSQINQVVSNITPTSQATPAVQGDESTGTTGTTVTTSASGVNQAGPIRQVFEQIGNIGSAFNPFNQGGQQNNASQAPNQNFIQSIGQNIGNVFQNIQNQFRPPGAGTPQKPAAGGETPSSNPIVGQVSNVGNQVQQTVGQVAGNNPLQNLIPESSSGTPAKAPAGEQSTAAAVAEESPETKPEEVEKKEFMTATE